MIAAGSSARTPPDAETAADRTLSRQVLRGARLPDMAPAVIADEHRQFLAEHRLCVVGTNRSTGPPALSPVFYLFDNDEIVVSITATRQKYRAVQNDPDVSLCVLHEEFPFPYVTVYGRGRVEHEGAADV